MTYIVSYQKFINSERTVEIVLPEDAETRQRIGSELATIDSTTYVSLPDGATLPAQPEEITVTPVELTPALKLAIKDACPFVRMILSMVAEKIAQRYSQSDEIKLLRTAPSAEFEAYNEYAESCREWGREQKALLGL